MLDKTSVAERIGVVGLALDGVVVARERLLETVQVFEGVGAFVVCLGARGVRFDGLVVQLDGPLEIVRRRSSDALGEQHVIGAFRWPMGLPGRRTRACGRAGACRWCRLRGFGCLTFEQLVEDGHQMSLSMPERTRRLFFALWPDEPSRAALVHATRKAVRHSGGRPVAEPNLHATLLFLGSVAESRVWEVATIGARAAAETLVARDHLCASPAGFVFDRIELWQKAHVLVATTSASSGGGHLAANALV